MKIDQLLSSLSKVKKTGAGRWTACCPAHQDKGPSLAIKMTPDTVMLHCFAGCSAEEVLGAVGMTFSDLYPDHGREVKPQRFPASDALACVAFEALVVMASAGTMRKRDLTPTEASRLAQASGRINAAMEMAGVR